MTVQVKFGWVSTDMIFLPNSDHSYQSARIPPGSGWNVRGRVKYSTYPACPASSLSPCQRTQPPRRHLLNQGLHAGVRLHRIDQPLLTRQVVKVLLADDCASTGMRREQTAYLVGPVCG